MQTEVLWNSFMSTLWKRFSSAGKTVSKLKKLELDKNELYEEEELVTYVTLLTSLILILISP